MITDVCDRILEKSRLMPHPCYSMKETEARLKSLSKENFNLKLRIYFLEMTSVSSNTAQRTNTKKYIELIKENESLKNDLEEKLGLIKQAAMAIDILEKNQKEKNVENNNKRNIQLQTIKTQKKTIASLKLVISAYSNKAENLQIIKNDVVTKLRNKLDILKECQLIFLDQITNIDDKIKKSKMQLLINEVRDQKPSYDVSLLKKSNTELKHKCHILHSIISNNEKLLNEQAELIKALNKTVTVKNQAISGIKLYKEKVEPHVYESPLTLNLINNDNSLREILMKELPLFNPLYGVQFENSFI